MTPGIRLKAALKAAWPVQRAALEAAIEPRLIRRAALGQQVNASTHLQLSGLLGLDPVSGALIPPRKLGEIHYPSLSAALRMKRIAENLNLRRAAKRAKASYSSLGRIERGEPVSIDAILTACAWLGRHPFEFVSPDVSREAPAHRSAA